MSFILKALKKLEVEKAASKAAPVEINSAILAPDEGRFALPRGMGKWAIAITVLLTVGAGLAYLLVREAPTSVVEVRKSEPAPAPVAPAALPMQPVVPEGKSARDMAKPDATAEAKTPARPKEQEKRPEALRLRNRPAPSPETGRYQARSDAASPSLNVSGIAYQDNPAESMAVVNGALVKSGMTVGGAQVERIFVDRVRFRGDGGVFEVPLAR